MGTPQIPINSNVGKYITGYLHNKTPHDNKNEQSTMTGNMGDSYKTKSKQTNQVSERNLRQKRIYCIILFVSSKNKQTNKNTGKSNLCSWKSRQWLFMQVGSGCKELHGGGGFWNADKV